MKMEQRERERHTHRQTDRQTDRESKELVQKVRFRLFPTICGSLMVKYSWCAYPEFPEAHPEEFFKKVFPVL